VSARVSARLLQEDKAFRKAADEKVASLTADPSFRLFDTPSIRTEDFEIVYVIVAPWKGQGRVNGLSPAVWSVGSLTGSSQPLLAEVDGISPT
jgi:hypothetical protein